MDDNIIKIPDSEKTLTAGKLFYNWFAANIGIMGFVFGAMIVSYHLWLGRNDWSKRRGHNF